MRILLGIAGLAMGGAERVVLELARSLMERGDPVALAGDSGPLDRELEELGPRRYPVPGYGRSPIMAARAVVALRSGIRDFEPDVIHSQNVKATGIAALARLRFRNRVPLLSTFQGVDRGEYRRAALILRAADRIACVSQDLAAGLVDHGVAKSRLEVIHNAVPLADPLSSDRREALDRELGLEGGPVVAIVGRLVAQKAHHRFLDAAARVARRTDGCRFLIVGDGPLRRDLEAQARRLGLSDHVRFTSIRDDARDLIARSDLIVFSSDWEGLALAALEALAAGVPVVATDVEGMRELLGDGAGVVVPRDAEALAEAIVLLLEDDERRAQMGRIGRTTISTEFSVERMISQYIELYGKLASASNGTDSGES
jgi:glycosyltransferase involved in cell wall biosynthesis